MMPNVLWHFLPFEDVRYSVAVEGKADIVAQGRNDANDPEPTFAASFFVSGQLIR